MNKYNIDKDHIYDLLDSKSYGQLFTEYCNESKQSITKLAASFKVSRRAIKRYMSGERQVSMAIIKMILQQYGIIYKREQDEILNIREFTEDNSFIWYGADSILFNLLYAYRIEKFKLSRFEAACLLNIPEITLMRYEHGLQKISIPDIKLIKENYHLKLNELFPELISYDSGKTYLPLHPVVDFYIDDIKYNLLTDDSPYRTPENEELTLWPEFPIMRYDNSGKPLQNYMPDELNMDEYFNSDNLCFPDDLDLYEHFVWMKLPPTYCKQFEPYQEKNINLPYFNRTVVEVIFKDDYSVIFRGCMNAKFSLKEYVFSDSRWYNMLQDLAYFKLGKLMYIGEEDPVNQCIIWPDGQYVRIAELYVDKYPYKYYIKRKGLTSNKMYDTWIDYELSKNIVNEKY